MNTKLIVKWIVLVLMCALVFGAVGYAYGSFFTAQECNTNIKLLQELRCPTVMIDKGLQTISTDTQSITEKVLENNKVNING